ncbi:Uncharacterised protein [Vibrio cholerae]|nr:Uncharacterised protein [Vibrio cholerae]
MSNRLSGFPGIPVSFVFGPVNGGKELPNPLV